MLKYILFLVLAFSVASCDDTGKTSTEELRAYDSTGVEIDPKDVETVEHSDIDGFLERFSRRKSDYAKHGPYSKYAPDGKIAEKAFYLGDTLHGVRVLYDEKADTQIVENYEMGSYQGPFMAYYRNGQLELYGEYVDNIMSGNWKRYYKTGELMEIVTFKDNKENGPFIEYYKNGNLKAEGEYLDGNHEHGLLKMYNEAGELVKKMQCEKGICSTIWRLEEDKSADSTE